MAWFGVFIILLCLHDWMISAVEYKMDGATYFLYSLGPKARIADGKSTIHMLFRTARPSGLLLHGRGTNGDFFTVEIVRGKLRYASVFDRGSSKPGYQDVVVGDDLGDDQWHQIDIERHGNHVIIKLDITKRQITSGHTRKPLNIDHDLSVARLPPRSSKVASDPSLPQLSLTGNSFRGCMEDVSYNKVNIFQAIKEKSQNVQVTGNVQSKCAQDREYHPSATLTRPTSFIQLNTTGEQNLHLKFKCRTFDHSGILVHHSFGHLGNEHLLVELVLGKLWLKYRSASLYTQVNVSPKIPSLANGLWNQIQLNFSHEEIAIQVNNETVQRILNISQKVGRLLQNSVLRIGSKLPGKSSIIGCVKEIHLNDKENVVIEPAMTKEVDIEKCYLIDRCYSNPCLHNGRCLQHNNTLRCDCSRTAGYYGVRCENFERVLHSTTNIPPSYQTKTRRIKTMISNPTPMVTFSGEPKLSRHRSSEIILTSTKLPVKLSKINLHSTTNIPRSYHTRSPSIKTTISKATPMITLRMESKLSSSDIISSSRKVPVKVSKTLAVIPQNSDTKLSSTYSLSDKPQSLISSSLTTQWGSPSSTSLLHLAHATIITRVADARLNNIRSTTADIYRETTAASSTVHSSSVRVMNPTTSRENDQRIIVIEKRNEFTTVALNKDQILVYLFLSIIFILFIGLVVIISVKVSRLKLCRCLSRCGESSRSCHDSLELDQHDVNEEGAKQTKRRSSRRPPSLNDSGIDPSDSGMASNRSSAEVNTIEEHPDIEAAQMDCETPQSSHESSLKGFLVLQEHPTVYTQESFGWSVLEGDNPRRSRISTDNFVENSEQKLRTMKTIPFKDDRTSENATGSVDNENEAGFERRSEKTHNQTTRYQQLRDEECSSLENVYIDIRS